jgi:hypothetical protein
MTIVLAQPEHTLDMVRVHIELTECTRYGRTVQMTRAELARYRSLLSDGTDEEAKRDVADLMFSRFVDRMDDECVDQPDALVVTLKEVQPCSAGA